MMSRTVLVLLIIIFSVITFSSQTCRYSTDKLIGSRCYMFVTKSHNFESAQKYCHGFGYYLATVDNAIVSNFLASFAGSEFSKSNGQFWIGLSRVHDFSLFTWDDSTPFAFTNFASGYPNKEDYVAENIQNGKWVTIAAHKSLPFICSSNLTSTGTTTTTSSTSFRTSTKAGTTKPTVTTKKIVTTTTTVPKTTTTHRTACPSGFKLLGTKCFIVIEYGNDSDYPNVSPNSPPLTAESLRCQKVGAQLASIHSEDLDEQLIGLIYDKFNEAAYATIGLRNTDTSVENGKWSWFDNSTLDYTRFGNAFPKTGDLLAQASTNGFWNTYTRTAPTEGVICSMDL
ncbi:unnamed protein product [Caenorhabditis angaria]|uniref:C-type lectin domain-containing protein n=1 Tax=Caenorhabditis angaria TaxID=860376 RepID=A0A9P1IM59_9PELO|nr:unnamed protein product [Caenorhabditis angaria]